MESASSGDEEEGKIEEKNPNAVSNFRISKPLRDALKSKGIESLFPIQAMTFDIVIGGSDLVGRARTGQGKTLAFVLPIVESLVNGCTKALRKTGYGRSASVLVLLPTRELATQVFVDFEVYGGSLGLSSCCLYGGAPYQSLEIKLKRGVDIVVGIPGRVKDHIERVNINLGSLQFRVFDEADEMLRMGFVDDVELILGKVEDVSKVQTLLFGATLPDWVKHVTLSRYRSGKFMTLVATNVAARGLDINDCEPPRDVEAYIHRSGRTGRAGEIVVLKQGYTEIKKRSLLTCMENYVAVLLEAGRPIYTPSFAFNVLRRFLPEEKAEAVKGLALTADGKEAVFDVAADDLDAYLVGQENAANVSIEVLGELPRMQERDSSRGGRFGGGSHGGFGGRGSSSGGGRFSSGKGGWSHGFSDRIKDRFSNGFKWGRSRGGNR
ncbi:hypothetical protein Ancab_010178 [Ancistrocladus abbreviatus]